LDQKDNILDWIILFFAGLGAGVLNALAGGGSFVIFPALMLVGVPPVAANATNTFACLPGYASGAIGFYDAIMANRQRLVLYSIIALVAGYLGAEALLLVSDAQFSTIVPWLMLFAVLAFSFGGQLNSYLVSRSSGSKRAARAGAIGTAVLLTAICFYGGFFNAGLGIILLAFLVLAGYKDINGMNGIKLWLSTLVALTAVIRLAIGGSIYWLEGSVALVGATIGGYLAARLSYLIPSIYVRRFVIVYGLGLTVYFFWQVYG
jgi:uncharacterized membrane protein YfcA